MFFSCRVTLLKNNIWFRNGGKREWTHVTIHIFSLSNNKDVPRPVLTGGSKVNHWVNNKKFGFEGRQELQLSRSCNPDCLTSQLSFSKRTAMCAVCSCNIDFFKLKRLCDERDRHFWKAIKVILSNNKHLTLCSLLIRSSWKTKKPDWSVNWGQTFARNC